MTRRSTRIGNRVSDALDRAETSAINSVHSGADGARQLGKAGSRWAAKHQTTIASEARLAKRHLEEQTRLLRKVAGKSVDTAIAAAHDSTTAGKRHLNQYRWPAAIVATSLVALLAGALLGRRAR